MSVYFFNPKCQIHPNIANIDGKNIQFTNGHAIEVDHIVMCTGYHIDVPFLSDEIKKELMDDSSNSIKVGHWFVN